MRKYKVKVIKTGREFKSFVTGVDFLNDNTLYRLEWELEGLWNLFRGYWGIAFKLPHEYIKEEAQLKR